MTQNKTAKLLLGTVFVFNESEYVIKEFMVAIGEYPHVEIDTRRLTDLAEITFHSDVLGKAYKEGRVVIIQGVEV